MAENNRFRTQEIRVKLSIEEYATILQKAYEAEMNISDAVRSLIVFGSINAKWLDAESKEIMNTANRNLRECINAINKIGVSLNTIAYYTNVVGDSDKEIVEAALGYTRDINYELLTCYEKIKELCDKASLAYNGNNQSIFPYRF